MIDRKKLGMDSADSLNCSEWRGRLCQTSPILSRGKQAFKMDMMMMMMMRTIPVLKKRHQPSVKTVGPRYTLSEPWQD